MESVALDAFCGQRPWQAENLGDIRLAAMESGIETGDLRYIGHQRLQGTNAGDVVRFVQRCQWDETGQVAEYG